MLFASNAFAAGDLSKQDPIVVRVDLGKSGTEKHKFYPDRLAFETGKLYKLVLHNPSNSKHYFTSLGLASKIYKDAEITQSGGNRANTFPSLLK